MKKVLMIKRAEDQYDVYGSNAENYIPLKGGVSFRTATLLTFLICDQGGSVKIEEGHRISTTDRETFSGAVVENMVRVGGWGGLRLHAQDWQRALLELGISGDMPWMGSRG